MFIHLHESLASDEIIESYIDSFSNIALGAIEGNHIISGDRTIIKLLAKSKALGSRERGVYFDLYNKLQDLNSIRKKLKIYARVVEQNTSSIHTENSSEVVLNIAEFSQSSLIQPTKLLGENLRDARVYRKIAESYLREKGLSSSIRICCTPDAGGGDTIGQKFQCAQIEESVFCLGIADSDRQAPTIESGRGLDGYGSTAKALIDAHRSHCTARCSTYIIPVRDIENLFFYEIYEHFIHIKKKDDKRQQLLLFKELVDFHSQYFFQKREHHILWYADIKNGTRLGKILIKKPGDQIYQFWIGYATYLFKKSKLCSMKSECIKEKKCLKNPEHKPIREEINKCECFITPALGEILKDVSEYFVREEKERRETTFTDLLSSPCLENPIVGKVWEEIGENVTAWCCSVAPIRTLSANRNSNSIQ